MKLPCFTSRHQASPRSSSSRVTWMCLRSAFVGRRSTGIMMARIIASTVGGWLHLQQFPARELRAAVTHSCQKPDIKHNSKLNGLEESARSSADVIGAHFGTRQVYAAALVTSAGSCVKSHQGDKQESQKLLDACKQRL